MRTTPMVRTDLDRSNLERPWEVNSKERTRPTNINIEDKIPTEGDDIVQVRQQKSREREAADERETGRSEKGGGIRRNMERKVRV